MALEEDDLLEMDAETTCGICYAEFLDPEDLMVHIQQVHNTKSCHFCSFAFSNAENYAIHLRDVHILSMKNCKYCTRLFTNADSHRQHEGKHCNSALQGEYKCSQCPEKFTNIFNLEQHELKNHKNAGDGVFLNEYHSLLSSVLNVKAPMLLQSLGSNVIYMCAICNSSTQDLNEYITHLKTKNCKSLVCETCSQVYSNRKALVNHFRHHKECYNYVKEDDKYKKCPSCHNLFDKLKLRQHLHYCKPVKCTLCSSCFTSIQELSEHQSVEHPLAISLTVCNFCHKEFVGTTSLNKHIDRVHRADFHLYKYACVYCQSTYFKHPKDLFAHFFSKHHEIEPYSCKICNKKFRIRKKFTIHLKLEHSSVGFVEFDSNYHVFFTEKKSENPFQPVSLFTEEQFNFPKKSKSVKFDSQVDASETEKSDFNDDVRNKNKNEDTEADKSEQTDMEEGMKPPKKRFRAMAANLVNVNSDFMSATETEAVQTETESNTVESKRKLKKKSKKMIKKFNDSMLESDDDEPLVNIKNKCKNLKKRWNVTMNGRQQLGHSLNRKNNRRHLTCSICKKYCYTQQNYQNHMSMHNQNEIKKCVKCSSKFKSTAELNRHMESEHASSKLTETLKYLLEKRKHGNSNTNLTTTEKFLRTIRRVKPSPSTPAKITEVNDELSVQSFIENFTPESNEMKKKTLSIAPKVLIKKVFAMKKPSAIKITKFKPKPINTNIKLAMPVRFKNNSTEQYKATIKLVNLDPVITNTYSIPDTHYEESFVDYEDTAAVPESPQNETVLELPEVAEEVMLSSDDAKPQSHVIPHKIVIPKLPEGYKDIRIAHLLPEAPYFKIVKVNDLEKGVMELETNNPEPVEEKEEEIHLPSGTKLVHVNPLAHLLGDTPIEKIVPPTTYKKNYKPKRGSYHEAIAKALMNLENPRTPKKKNTKKKNVEVEQ